MCRPSVAKERVVVQFGQLKYKNPLKPADGGEKTPRVPPLQSVRTR